MIIESPKNREFKLAEEGEQIAVLDKIKDLGMLDDPFKPGEKAHYMRLIWKVGKDVYVTQKCKVTMHHSSKLYDIATQLLQTKPPDRINTDELIGRTAYITVRHNPGSDGNTYANIVDVRATAYQGRKTPTITEAAQPAVVFGRKTEAPAAKKDKKDDSNSPFSFVTKPPVEDSEYDDVPF